MGDGNDRLRGWQFPRLSNQVRLAKCEHAGVGHEQQSNAGQGEDRD